MAVQVAVVYHIHCPDLTLYPVQDPVHKVGLHHHPFHGLAVLVAFHLLAVQVHQVLVEVLIQSIFTVILPVQQVPVANHLHTDLKVSIITIERNNLF